MAGKKYRVTKKSLNFSEGEVVKLSFPGIARGYKKVKILEIEPNVQTLWGKGRVKILPLESGNEVKPFKLAFSQCEIFKE